LAAHHVLCPDVPCPGSLSFSAVLQLRAERQVRRVRHCVPASAGRCIPLDLRLRERVRWAWGLRFRLREQRDLVLVRAGLRGGPVSVMFRVA
jgi:hypothetical protein